MCKQIRVIIQVKLNKNNLLVAQSKILLS